MPRKKTPSKAELDALIKTIRKEMQSHAVPPKRRTKLTTKMTENSFNKNLHGVPGGPMNSPVRILFAIRKMIDAEETGTIIAGPTILRRLQSSGQHCDTTKSNYLV